jgi:hypothetical protein
MARLKLHPIHEQALLIWGLVSPLPSHKFCWIINQSMDWNLSRKDDIIVSVNTPARGNGEIWASPSAEEACYDRYGYEDEGWLYHVEIISNKAEAEPLFPELKNFDYLMVVYGETAHFPKNVKDVFQKLDGIHSVLTLNPQRIKEFPRLQAYIG